MRLIIIGLAASVTTLPCSVVTGDESGVVELYERGKYELVVERLCSVHDTGQASTQQRLLLARSHFHLDQLDDSLAVLRTVLDAGVENAEVSGFAGLVLFRLSKHEEAVEHLAAAYRVNTEPRIGTMLGQCYDALGRLLEAKRYLEEALRSDAGDPATSFTLGRIHLARGAGALAEKHLLMAKEAGMDAAACHRSC